MDNPKDEPAPSDSQETEVPEKKLHDETMVPNVLPTPALSQNSHENEDDEPSCEFVDAEDHNVEGGKEEMAEVEDDDEYEDVDSTETADDEDETSNEESPANESEETREQAENEDANEFALAKENSVKSEDGDQVEEEESKKTAAPVDKNLDHADDSKNPQYIPKRGAFYEHDDRALSKEDVVETLVEEKPKVVEKKVDPPPAEKRTKGKKLWSEDGKWGHDMFNDDEQKPKAREELINTYGYDIRDEDGPPKARRRRKYGRGPNRYTRDWKDQDAYARAGELPRRSVPRRDKDLNEKSPRRRTPSKTHSSRDRRSSSSSRKDRETERDRFNDAQNSGQDRREPKNISHEERRRASIPRNEKSGGFRRTDRNDDRERRRDIEREPRSDSRSNRRPPNTLSEHDFPELPGKSKERRKILSGPNQPTPWSKYIVRNQDSYDEGTSKDRENDYKTEPMKIIETIDNKKRGFTQAEDQQGMVVKTQIFENSRSTRRPQSNSSNSKEHNQRPESFSKSRSFGRNEVRDMFSKDMERPGRSCRLDDNIPINADGFERDERKNRFPVRRDRDFKDRRGMTEERDKRRSDDHRIRGNMDRSFDVRESHLSSQMNKLSLERRRSSDLEQTKTNHGSSGNSSSEPRGRDRVNYSSYSRDGSHPQAVQGTNTTTKRYSSLRQQQQKLQQPTQNPQSKKQSSDTVVSSDQYQTVQINVKHPRQPSASNFYDAQTSSSTSNYYPETRSSQSSYNYIPPNGMEQGRFSQMAPRPYIASTAPPPDVISQGLQRVPSAPTAAPSAALPPVITGPPGATYLPTYPPGYAQFTPPPAAQFPINIQHPDLFNGVTYYDTMTQQATPRQLPQRRQKNALPILPPSGADEVSDSDINQGVETVT